MHSSQPRREDAGSVHRVWSWQLPPAASSDTVAQLAGVTVEGVVGYSLATISAKRHTADQDRAAPWPPSRLLTLSPVCGSAIISSGGWRL